MRKYKFLIITLCSLLLLQTGCQDTKNKKYNVIFILADDLGWKDLACYGSHYYETPNIDGFAKTGILFTNAYSSSPLCSPTRASILTGQEPGRLRFTLPNGHEPQAILDPVETDSADSGLRVAEPQTRTRLPNEYLIFPEVLKANGYTTAFMGKWHLGREPYIPENQGFDVVVGGREQGWPPYPGRYFAPWNLATLPDSPAGTHICDAVTDTAISFIEKNQNQPFLLCLWYYDVHGPWQTKEEKRTYFAEKLGPEDIQRNPTMGGMISVLDDNVGRILRTLESLKLTEETIVIFTSDNGGNMYAYPDGMIPTNNYPLRNGKASNYEGGVKVPLIIRVPGMTEPNTKTEVITSSSDHYLSLLELVGIPFPKEVLTDGQSYVNALKGREYERKPLYSTFYHDIPPTGNRPNISMRSGSWKLYRFFFDGINMVDRYELYNLDVDPGESINLTHKNPEIFRPMMKQMDDYMKEADILKPHVNKYYAGNVTGGWRGSDDAEISIEEHILKIHSTGSSPRVATIDGPMLKNDDVILQFEMKSNSSGGGKVSWGQDKDIGNSPFDAIHDDEWHSYQVDIHLTGALSKLEILPSNAEGEIWLKNIKLVNKEGYFIYDWILY